jgi:Fe-S-cluster-containing hydrogenase component 2
MSQAQELTDLEWGWEQIAAALRELGGVTLNELKKYHQEGHGKKGLHFFAVEYRPGAAILARGTTSDYAAVHLSGRIVVHPEATERPSRGLGCWSPPAVRRGLERALADPKFAAGKAGGEGTGRKTLTVWKTDEGPGATRVKLPLSERILGVTGALWNQPRSVTLLAQNDPDDPEEPNAPCRMLLIKRKALTVLFGVAEGGPAPLRAQLKAAGEPLLKKKLSEFVAVALPDILANNRLFRDLLYVEDVLDWDRLLTCLRRRVADLLDGELRVWLARLPSPAEDADRQRIVSGVNDLLADRRLSERLAAGRFDEATGELLRRRAALSDCESFRLNRLLLHAACPEAFSVGDSPWPLLRVQFATFAEDVAKAHEEKTGQALQPEPFEKGAVVFAPGDPADAVYLVLSGMVRVSRPLHGGEAVAHNLDRGGHFGEAAAVPDDLPGSTGKRAAEARALCKSYLLRLDAAALRSCATRSADYDWLLGRMLRAWLRTRRRDEEFAAGRTAPPREPPPQIADRLVLTRNLLLIDMDRCSRCDACVRGCAAAHDGQPRFHRANPELRFGRWEVAGACLHCLDAPCLEACPVGAITLLEDRAVQIHRSRCIGCEKCAEACPFGVIDMYPAAYEGEAASSKRQIVANKCDLCLTESADPPCVACCPYDAAQRVDPARFFRGLRGRSRFAEDAADEPEA